MLAIFTSLQPEELLCSMEAVKAAIERPGDEALPSVAGFRGPSSRVLQPLGLAPPGLYRHACSCGIEESDSIRMHRVAS